MNPEKAIEILSMDLTYTYPARYDDLQKAIKLGIEALSFIELCRVAEPGSVPVLLHGETEE